MRDEGCSFLKERTKELFRFPVQDSERIRAKNGKSLFASVSSEKEDSAKTKLDKWQKVGYVFETGWNSERFLTLFCNISTRSGLFPDNRMR